MPTHCFATMLSRRLRVVAPLIALTLAACGGGSSTGTAPTPTTPTAPTTPTTPPAPSGFTVPAIGSAALLDVGTWNVEWFGDASNGPSDEVKQASQVRAVLAAAGVDIWGLQEVVSATSFRELVNGLTGYAGVLATDAIVTDGARFYSDFNNTEQKVALIVNSAVASVLDARVILVDKDYEFAGRPPVEFLVRVTLNGSVDTIPVIVLHAKAGSDATSYARRLAASTALKNWAEQTYPARPVWIIGDFNDDFDTSITTGQPSPYEAFVRDTVRWSTPTKALSDARIASTVSYPDIIDHHLLTRPAGLRYVAQSARAWRLDSIIPSYKSTTTDHYPVIAQYRTR